MCIYIYIYIFSIVISSSSGIIIIIIIRKTVIWHDVSGRPSSRGSPAAYVMPNHSLANNDDNNINTTTTANNNTNYTCMYRPSSRGSGRSCSMGVADPLVVIVLVLLCVVITLITHC